MRRIPFVFLGLFTGAGVFAAGLPTQTQSVAAKPAVQPPADRVLTAARVPAKPAETYALARQNGPWLILVTTFLGHEASDRANQLAEELRTQHRLPAYTFARRAQPVSQLRRSNARPGLYEQIDQVAVLAGEFPEADDRAKKTLDRVKQLQPKCIGGDGKAPLRGAILVFNPLIPPEERPDKKPDPLIEKMNKGEYNLFHCPGKFSLQVANFRGARLLLQEAKKPLEPTSKLQEAGEHAEQLARLLRKAGYEAYVFHNLQSSIVTVGSFAAADDVRMEPLRQTLANAQHGQFRLMTAPRPVQVPKKAP
jgi:hypothetical protein